jgi:hypothetical protein
MGATRMRTRAAAAVFCAASLLLAPREASGAESSFNSTNLPAAAATGPLADVLGPEKWRQVEESVDRALVWLSGQQAANGSFPAIDPGQPAVTSLCVLAFLSRGHQPGLGPYGAQMERAIDFALSTQRDGGLFSLLEPEKVHRDKAASHTAVYNHAITGLMLGEVYGHVSGDRAKEVKTSIEAALRFTRQLQTRPKAHPVDEGGWRYLRLRWDRTAADSDLSVTGWQLMFLRSAKNAEFAVPQPYVDDAMRFVENCWDPEKNVFNYALVGQGDIRSSRGMVGVGILSLSMAGKHQTSMAQSAGEWLAQHPIRSYGDLLGTDDNFFYSAYYCSQAMAQLGGNYWRRFFPELADAMLGGQREDGSWPPEPRGTIRVFGNAYTTALAVLSLTPPYQLLPVYQR